MSIPDNSSVSHPASKRSVCKHDIDSSWTFGYATEYRWLQNASISILGPEAPRVAAVKKINLVHRGKCRGFFAKFFAAIFPGN